MENCIFCKIVKNEIPSEKIYEDEKFLVFLDIQPVLYGHLLIIPKKHVIWMQDASDETIAGIFTLAKKLMPILIKNLNYDFVNINVNGKDIPHFHVHLIPRLFNDGLGSWETKTYKEGEMKEISKKITQGL